MMITQLLKQVDDIQEGLADDYLCICLTSERDFYESARAGCFTFDVIAELVNQWLPQQTTFLLKYHEIDMTFGNEPNNQYMLGRVVERMFPKEVVKQAILDIEEYYAEEKEELANV